MVAPRRQAGAKITPYLQLFRHMSGVAPENGLLLALCYGLVFPVILIPVIANALQQDGGLNFNRSCL